MYVVYILKGEKYYCGYTNDLERRIKEHKGGKTYTTRRIGEFELEGYFECENKKEAIELEKRIKKSKKIKRYTGEINFKKIVQR